jgi:rhodanese-related sulfurtransferase
MQPDKTQPVGVFCVSAECWLSVNAALRLRALGYTNVQWYRGGIEAWMAAKLPTVTAVPHATVWSQ